MHRLPPLMRGRASCQLLRVAPADARNVLSHTTRNGGCGSTRQQGDATALFGARVSHANALEAKARRLRRAGIRTE